MDANLPDGDSLDSLATLTHVGSLKTNFPQTRQAMVMLL